MLAWLTAALLAGAAAADPVVARFAGGEVRRSDVEREAAFVRRDEARWRRETGQPAAEARRDWTQRVALRRLALATARVERLDEDPLLREAARAAGRRWLVEMWAESCYGRGFPPVDEEALRREAEAALQPSPARLRLHHVFLRAADAAQERAATERLAAWAAEVGSLDEFQELARRHSQSSTGPLGGLLGTLVRGSLPEAAEEILYRLPAGTVSPPIPLRGGVHLFFVEKNLPAAAPPLATALAARRERARAEALAACRAAVLAGSALAVRRGDSAWPDLEVGAWRLGGETLARLAGGEAERAAPEALERLIAEEILFQEALASGEVEDRHRRHLEDLAADVYLEEIVRRQVEAATTEPSSAELEAFAAARGRPLRKRRELRLDVLSAPLPAGADPLAFSDRLAALGEALAGRGLAWEAAAVALGPGARFERLPRLDDLALVGGRLEPRLFEAIKDLPAGAVSRPLRHGDRLYLIGVAEVIPGRALTFAEAQPQLRRLWLAERRRLLAADVVASVLARHGFHYTEAGETWLAGPAARPEEVAQP